jgi:hypothetical protein
MATRILRADIQSCQIAVFWGTSSPTECGINSTLTGIFYAHVKANKMPTAMTYYTNILSTIMFAKSSNLTFDLVFLKMQYLIFLEEKYIPVTIIRTSANINLGLQWD